MPPITEDSLMTEQATLPAGRKLCPGWASDWPKPAGTKVACGSSKGRSSVRGDQALISEHNEMCDRCRRAKKRWDEQNGQREDLAKKDAERRAVLMALYLDDIKEILPAGSLGGTRREFLAAVVTAVDRLEEREALPPHQKVSVKYGRTTRPIRDVYAGVKLSILRSVAGLPE